MSQTLYDKLMSAHIVHDQDGASLIYIDLQLIHEVTSPQAFEGLAEAGRKIWRNKSNLAVPDHNVPTTERSCGVTSITDPISRLQV
jgi:3-isopropylmalate/(R)-2-methylmalate dehydratase large subunit